MHFFGKTGQGKSSLLKALMDYCGVDSSEFVIGNNATSTTKKITWRTVNLLFQDMFLKVQCVDTPGLFDNEVDISEMVKQMEGYLDEFKNLWFSFCFKSALSIQDSNLKLKK